MTLKESIEYCDEIIEKTNNCECRKDLEDLRNFLKELLEYREFGTLKELAISRRYIKLAKMHGTIGEVIDECVAYEELGTVDELQKALETRKELETSDDE